MSTLRELDTALADYVRDEMERLRREAGYSRCHASRVSGLGDSQWANIVNIRGPGCPSIRTLRKVAAGFGKELRVQFVDPEQ
jgi:hypothetical protein